MKKRSKFSLSNYKLASMKMGYVVPINLTEVLPGDSVQQSTGIFMRLAPMVAPVMHPVHMTVQHFFVPTRLLWDDFEDFITGGPDGTDTSVPPTLTVTPTASSLADYLGLPVGKALTVSALPFRAYDLIWNEYYRDQDLMQEVAISTDSGTDTTTSTSLLRPCWSKDYFTTARPWPQKGPEVTIPVNAPNGKIGTVNLSGAQIIGKPGTGGLDPAATPTFTPYESATCGDGKGWLVAGSLTAEHRNNAASSFESWSRIWNSAQWAGLANTSAKDSTEYPFTSLQWLDPHLAISSDGNLGTSSFDVQSTSGGLGSVNVNDLREAMSLQRFQEHRALFGSRYEDYLRYIGVRPQDARLQLPEYLGGGSQTIQFSEVLQTGGDAVGSLFGHGIAAMRTNRFRRFIPEHGYIISLLMVRPIPVYTQGIERLWHRETKEDYWQKELQHIGQQEVLNQEVYADGTAADKETFGFQNRYDEYRRGVNTVSGEFRTNQTYWHMARIFANRPALNADFVQNNPTDRIFQADEKTSDQLYVMAQNNIIARRLVDKNGNPI